jgi:hypothetical protein
MPDQIIMLSDPLSAPLSTWLLRNGIDPYDLLPTGTIAIEAAPAGRRIRFSVLLKGPDGRPYDVPTDAPAPAEEHTAPLCIEPPASLLGPVLPTTPADSGTTAAAEVTA